MFILKEEIQTLSVQNVVEEDADKLEESTKKVSFMTSSLWTNKQQGSNYYPYHYFLIGKYFKCLH